MGIAATVFSCQRKRSSLASLLDDAETRGDITANETDQLDKADLILTADDQSEHLLAEISITLHQHDIDRAATQARLLAKPTGQPVATLVIGAQEESGLRRREPLSLPILEPLLESRVDLQQHFPHIVQGFSAEFLRQYQAKLPVSTDQKSLTECRTPHPRSSCLG